MIVTGNRAYKLFKSLDRDGNGCLDAIELGNQKDGKMNSKLWMEVAWICVITCRESVHHHHGDCHTPSIFTPRFSSC